MEGVTVDARIGVCCPVLDTVQPQEASVRRRARPQGDLAWRGRVRRFVDVAYQGSSRDDGADGPEPLRPRHAPPIRRRNWRSCRGIAPGRSARRTSRRRGCCWMRPGFTELERESAAHDQPDLQHSHGTQAGRVPGARVRHHAPARGRTAISWCCSPTATSTGSGPASARTGSTPTSSWSSTSPRARCVTTATGKTPAIRSCSISKTWSWTWGEAERDHPPDGGHRRPGRAAAGRGAGHTNHRDTQPAPRVAPGLHLPVPAVPGPGVEGRRSLSRQRLRGGGALPLGRTAERERRGISPRRSLFPGLRGDRGPDRGHCLCSC